MKYCTHCGYERWQHGKDGSCPYQDSYWPEPDAVDIPVAPMSEEEL